MAMTKERILGEIRRLAAANGGTAPGRRAFLAETGIKDTDWHGVHWIRWGNAVREAGFAPNAVNAAIPHGELLTRLADLTRELGHYPIAAEFRMKARSDASFPNEKAFRQFGGKRSLMARLREFCAARGEGDVVALCQMEGKTEEVTNNGEETKSAGVRYVYLVRHGSRREYKIGRTFNLLRRQGEIRTELPEQLAPIHQIETDDPSGVERYWHTRFAAKRKNGEWFSLDQNDIRAFKRWRRIY